MQSSRLSSASEDRKNKREREREKQKFDIKRESEFPTVIVAQFDLHFPFIFHSFIALKFNVERKQVYVLVGCLGFRV